MQKILYLAVFVSGMTTLAIEMAASRLLGNVFGTSNLVWASIIGLILIYLAVGNYLGGILADKYPRFSTFFIIQIISAVAIALVPVISKPILRLSANAFDQLQLGVLFGSFLTVFIILCIPIILLGTISPFAIRLAINDTQTAGKISGKIYATSTLGSFVGAFLPVLVLIPTLGTYRTFLVLAALLAVMGLVGLGWSSGRKAALYYLWAPILIFALSIWGLSGNTKSTPELIYETESEYNYIQVLEVDGYRLLRLNEGQGIHSVFHPEIINYYGPWEIMLVGPFFNSAPYPVDHVNKIAIVGLAAGTTARQASILFPGIEIDGFEIDPKIVEVGQKYFDMNQPNLNIIIQDGRWGLEQTEGNYDLISIDAYRPPYIPWHFTTREFFELVRRKLSPQGVMAINVGRSPEDRRLVNALGTTIRAVFPSVHVMDVPNSFNTIIFASVTPTFEKDLELNYANLLNQPEINPLLLESIKTTLENMQPQPEPGPVFTDDLAPVEWITNNMVLNFLFTGDREVLN